MYRKGQPTPETLIAARRAYAEVLRHFASGLLTNEEYEDQAFAIEGFLRCNACQSVSWAARCLYDDIIPRKKLTGKHRLSVEARFEVARWIVFLRSGCQSIEATPERRIEKSRYRLLVRASLATLGGLTVVIAFVNAHLAIAFISGLSLVSFVTGVIRMLVGDFIRWFFGSKPIERTPQEAIWPFANQSDYLAALQTAGYLGRSGK